MENKSTFKKLQTLVSRCAGSVLFIPTKNEVDYNDPSFPLEMHKDNILIIPKDKNNDPFEWADSCIAKFKNNSVCILIPGTRFDAFGTRHGNGAGWYDRFLSKVPPLWLRVGVCNKSTFSHSKLLKNSWDQPVDWIIVRDSFYWSVHKTSHGRRI